MSKLTLIRGLPGSGKSTLARKLMTDGSRHYEADMYFEVNGEYLFDPRLLPKAHKWCQNKARAALNAGLDVIVSNTFSQRWEMQPYIDMAGELGATVEILTAVGNYQNIHGVPAEAIQRMRSRWEQF